MTDKQWKDLKDIINGKILSPLPAGFIIDSPWLPGWYGINIIDYYTNDELWFEVNRKALETFPEIMFFPGFWSEYGMCSEPSAFGARCSFPRNEFPHAYKVLNSIEDIDSIICPNPETDGLSPFLLNRLLLYQNRIEDLGHKIRFSVSRGPLNIASYLMGITELMTGMMLYPDAIHELFTKITEYLVKWHELQRHTFPSIDGIMVLDDIIGFIGEEDFRVFALPYFKELYDNDLTVKLLHNDADCSSSAKYLPEMGVNMFNMGFETSLNELKNITKNKVVMLGNIPPRDVLAKGGREEIITSVADLKKDLDDHSMVIYSCGGGMPPGVSTESLRAFCHAVNPA